MSDKKEAFNDWLENPVTKYFIKYLNDSVTEESEMIAENIANGGIITENEMIKTSTMCITLKQIADISLEEIEGFYNKEE